MGTTMRRLSAVSTRCHCKVSQYLEVNPCLGGATQVNGPNAEICVVTLLHKHNTSSSTSPRMRSIMYSSLQYTLRAILTHVRSNMTFICEFIRHVSSRMLPFLDWSRPSEVWDGEMALVSGPIEVRPYFLRLLINVDRSLKPVLLEETISGKLTAICRAFPSRMAIKTPASQLTYLDLDQQSDSLALGLLDLGIKTGDRVAISLGNCAAYGVVRIASRQSFIDGIR